MEPNWNTLDRLLHHRRDFDVAQRNAVVALLSQEFGEYRFVGSSLHRVTATAAVIGAFCRQERCLVILERESSTPLELPGKEHLRRIREACRVRVVQADTTTILTLSEHLSWLSPRPNPGKPALGLGDCLGNATSVFIQAVKDRDLFPVLALQSPRDNRQWLRAWSDVLADAMWGVFLENWQRGYGAEAVELETVEDAEAAASAGFVRFSLNLSRHLVPVHQASKIELSRQFVQLEKEWPEVSGWRKRLLGRSFPVEVSGVRENLMFDEKTFLQIAVRMAPVIQQATVFSRVIRSAARGRPVEIEIDLRQSARPISALEHLFLALELKHQGVPLKGFVPQLSAQFVDGVDFIRNTGKLVRRLRTHCGVAIQQGYPLSLPGAGDKFSLYPRLKRGCSVVYPKLTRSLMVEGLRVVARKSPRLLDEVVARARVTFGQQFESQQAVLDPKLLSPPSAMRPGELEKEYFETRDGRLLMAAFFSAETASARELLGYVLSTLQEFKELHSQTIREYLDRHIDAIFATGDESE